MLPRKVYTTLHTCPQIHFSKPIPISEAIIDLISSPANHSLPPNLLVHASVPSNTFAIYGNGEEKELTELVPGILNQLGPDSLASLRKLAESYQKMQGKEMGAGGDEKKEAEDDDDDDIPDLVPGETFDSKVD